ncbi:hypothetical protein MTO96_000053 [Rhipicephalus appendiculatus]
MAAEAAQTGNDLRNEGVCVECARNKCADEKKGLPATRSGFVQASKICPPLSFGVQQSVKRTLTQRPRVRGGGGRPSEHAVAHGKRAVGGASAASEQRSGISAHVPNSNKRTQSAVVGRVQRLTARGALPTATTRVGWQSAERLPARAAPEEMPMLPLLASRAIKRSRR